MNTNGRVGVVISINAVLTTKKNARENTVNVRRAFNFVVSFQDFITYSTTLLPIPGLYSFFTDDHESNQ